MAYLCEECDEYMVESEEDGEVYYECENCGQCWKILRTIQIKELDSKTRAALEEYQRACDVVEVEKKKLFGGKLS